MIAMKPHPRSSPLPDGQPSSWSVRRQLVAGGFAALSRDDDIEGLTLADLDWYVLPPKMEEVKRAAFRPRGDS